MGPEKSRDERAGVVRGLFESGKHKARMVVLLNGLALDHLEGACIARGGRRRG